MWLAIAAGKERLNDASRRMGESEIDDRGSNASQPRRKIIFAKWLPTTNHGNGLSLLFSRRHAQSHHKAALVPL